MLAAALTICSTFPEGQQPRLSIIQELTWGGGAVAPSLQKMEMEAKGGGA